MSTTTYSAVRDTILSQIEGITPTSETSRLFRRHNEVDDLEVWAEAHPAAAFRRFDVRRVFDDDFPEVSNTDVEEELALVEVTVAYPRVQTGTYRSPSLRDVLMNEDKNALRKAVGIGGYANYTDAACIQENSSTIELEAVVFLRLQLTLAFYRSV